MSLTNDEIRSGQETEIKLLICSYDPQAVYESIIRLTSIAGCSLQVGDTLSMRDRYFDTPEGALRRRKWGLRIRTIGDRYWIALKGPATTTEWGGLQRTEIEGEWSRASVGQVLQKLRELGGSIQPATPLLKELQPVAAMHGLGMVLVQDRETLRLIRLVIAPSDENEAPAAEMACDHVIYHFQGEDIHHYEIEVEAVSDHTPNPLPIVSDGLREFYGDTLRIWVHDKLATGWAIEQLLRKEDFRALVKDGCLSAAGYDWVESFLKAPNPDL